MLFSGSLPHSIKPNLAGSGNTISLGRYNALSAFVLGYCLRDTLAKNYRWTNGQISNDLDIDTLAEIIETVVKDDGANKIGNKEKEICRLSKEEKEFIRFIMSRVFSNIYCLPSAISISITL